MDATARFDLDGREFVFTAPTALQFKTIHKIIDAYYSANYVRKRLGDIRHVVDVGACIGTMSLFYEALWPGVEILAIEPHPDNFKYLVENCKGFKNIQPVNIAISDKYERIRLAFPTQEQRPDVKRLTVYANVGMVSRYGLSDTFVAEVDAVPLDSIVGWNVDFLKVDVEGSELHVLHGAERVLSGHPLVTVELRPDNLAMAGLTCEDVDDYVRGMGYESQAKFAGDPLYQHRNWRPWFSSQS